MLMIGAAILKSRLFWVFVVSVCIWSYGYHVGNHYGSYADSYRAVIKELRVKNEMLTAQLAEDARIEGEEAQAAAVADAEFAKAMPGLNPLHVDKKTADALNALME